MTTPSSAYLVESIPKGLEDLRGTPGVQYTEDVLVRLTRAAVHSIDLTAMYWNLVPDPSSADEKGFTAAQFAEMGAGAGSDLLSALQDAARRGVRIRILQSPGFGAAKQESDTLQSQFPGVVSTHPIQMGDWYGGSGIMHQKIWVFDGSHVYLGSANMDWKSIMQVKEMGVAVENCPELAADVTSYLEGWFLFTSLTPDSAAVFDEEVRIARRVPAWSPLVPESQRAANPLAGPKYQTSFNHCSPLRTELNGKPAGLYITGCPIELLGEGRTYDGAALVDTINDARKSISISVMDFGPISLYSRSNAGIPEPLPLFSPADSPVWWPALFSALLTAVLTRKVYVRLLVSRWAHTSGLIEPFLRALQMAAEAGRADRIMTAGQLEIKEFVIPGWDSTTGSFRKFPGHSRVNHTKYIVTDRRINIGTSNMTWDYFTSTAGSSFNSDHPDLVGTLQAVFDRDWTSIYSSRLA